jgi:hypothetical protein
MSLLRPSLLLPAAALFATSALAEVKLGAQKYFKDWAVACDNRLFCEAVALQPESEPNGELSLSLSRKSDSGDIVISLSGFETASDRYRIYIDGRFADSGPVSKADPSIKVTGTDAIRLARSLARGRRLSLQDGSGAQLGTASLAGSSAALQYIDTMQGINDSRDALAVAGRRVIRGKSVAAPLVTAKRIVPTETTPDATTLVSLVEGSACAAERFGVTEDAAYSLGTVDGSAMALVMLSCGSGAYNFSSAAYVGRADAQGKWTFAPARFDYGNDVRTLDKSLPLLVNADWDTTTQTLSSFAKGRGLGDCGNAESYIWDGSMFRLIKAYGMEQCRGSTEWLTLWSAEVKFAD